MVGSYLNLPAQTLHSYRDREKRTFCLSNYLSSFWFLGALSIHLSSFWHTWVVSIHLLNFGMLGPDPFILLAFGMPNVRTSPYHHLGQWGQLPSTLTDWLQ